ncbi:MAG TPA: hypothetical protein PLP17_15855, partial [Oligoflexia bacterium]|nr:hypothetical protein [Oligoflexia bacterium]
MEESNPEEGQGAAASTADAAKTQEGKTKESRIPRWFVTFSVVVVLLIVILLIVLFGRLSSGPGGSPEASAPAETFTFDLAAVLTPADIKVITQGSAQVDQALIVPAASYALYNPAQRRLEIGFFRTPLAREVLEQLAKAQSFSDLTQVSPDIMFLIALKKSGSACEQAEIERYQVFINRNPEGAPEYLSMEFPDASGIVTIGCRFDQPAVVYAALRQDAQQQVEQGPAVRVFWDLRISSPAVVVPVTAKVAYDSTNAAAVVALWNKMDNTIEVGYFPSTLGADDREMMRKNKSLLAVPQKKPVVTAA